MLIFVVGRSCLREVVADVLAFLRMVSGSFRDERRYTDSPSALVQFPPPRSLFFRLHLRHRRRHLRILFRCLHLGRIRLHLDGFVNVARTTE